MPIDALLQQLRTSPETIEFQQVMDMLAEHYDYTPTGFRNGPVVNPAGTNEGSCKLFAFAQLHHLSELETLSLFGAFYRDDVMGNPAGDDHANIRHFILDGWAGMRFDGVPLQIKNAR